MNPGAIWWGQIGNSLSLQTHVANNLRDCRSTVLQAPGELPWKQDFYQAIDMRRSTFSSQRRLMRLQWPEGADPGAFVLDELCPAPVRAEYWPGQSYAEYLGTNPELVLNDYYVWVTGIHTKEDIARWGDFLAQYHKAARQLESFAVFFLEYDGPHTDVSGADNILYAIEKYDCRVFSLEAAAALGNTELKEYQAELALRICHNDPELCYRLLLTGERLLHAPVETSLEVMEISHPASNQIIQSAAWEAAVVLLFPVLERYRIGFIGKHEQELARHLPISNSNGDRITDPRDLEIGPLYYIVSSSRTFSPYEVEDIRLSRKVRNLLAHNKIVPVEDVKKVLLLHP